MAEKEEVKVEVVDKKKEDESKQEEPKKQSGFSKWWKGTKDTINADLLEDHIKTAYQNAHHQITVYVHGETSIFSGSSEYGEIKDNILTFMGKDELKPFSVIVDSLDNKAYYVVSSEKCDVEATYDGVTYTREGRKVTLDDKVEEVQVVKAGKRYFLYKGQDK